MDANNVSFFHYHITTDNEILDSKFNITNSARLDLERMGSKLMTGKNCIRELQACIRKYPNIPAFKNYLSNAYNNKGEVVKARKVNHEIVRLHPEYLYGKVNLANEFISELQFERVPKVLGESFEIQNLYTERKTFHIEEVLSFNLTAIHYFIGVGNFEAAESRLKALGKIAKKFDCPEKIEYLWAKLNDAQGTVHPELKNGKSIRNGVPTPDKLSTAPPVFANAKILLLYKADMLITEDEINSILNLPRASLVSDLCLVLKDSIDRQDYFETKLNYDLRTHGFPLHALFFLSELKAQESLPFILEFLRQKESYFEFWFDDFVTEGFWEILYHICADKPYVLLDLMKEPGLYKYVRTEISVFASQIALHHPDRRNEVIQWFKNLSEFYLENKNADFIDTEEIGLMICSIIDFGAPELNETISRLYAEGFVFTGIPGNLESVVRANRIDRKRNGKRKIYSILSRYENIIESWEYYNYEEIEDFEDLVFPAPGVPIRSEPKIRRNDPCPCGSGIKFKKCHGK